MQKEFNDRFSCIADCVLEKTTKAINNTKPDFLFKVLDENNNILGKVVVEAKTQTDKGKQLNREFYDKLEQDRKNHNAGFSLLVTELEPQEEFTVKKIADYHNMFVIRPDYFAIFMSLFYVLIKKMAIFRTLEINFAHKQEIMDQLSELKEKVNKKITDIDGDAKKILDRVDDLDKAANKIRVHANNIVNKGVQNLISTIDRFDVKTTKLTEKIAKIHSENPVTQPQYLVENNHNHHSNNSVAVTPILAADNTEFDE